MRSDALDNRARILAAAREAFAADGGRASLNKIVQAAGVGPGTLYRHFPSLPALLVALIADDVAALCAQGRSLLTAADPAVALRGWLRSFAGHATAMHGLVAAELAAVSADSALADAHAEIQATATALLARAGHSEVDAGDLLTLINAVAWASEQSPADPRRLDRLLTLATVGLATPRTGPPATTDAT
jgi:AcrR family transcriptional regulator